MCIQYSTSSTKQPSQKSTLGLSIYSCSTIVVLDANSGLIHEAVRCPWALKRCQSPDTQSPTMGNFARYPVLKLPNVLVLDFGSRRCCVFYLVWSRSKENMARALDWMGSECFILSRYCGHRSCMLLLRSAVQFRGIWPSRESFKGYRRSNWMGYPKEVVESSRPLGDLVSASSLWKDIFTRSYCHIANKKSKTRRRKPLCGLSWCKDLRSTTGRAFLTV